MLNDVINSFTYKGKCSKDFGIFITEKTGVFGDAKPIVETVSVPARGTLIMNNKIDDLDNEEFEDFEKVYTCAVDTTKCTEQIAKEIYAWLFGVIECDKLYDTYENGYYRMAYINSNASLSELGKNLQNFEVHFMCKAFKRLIAGDNVITITAASTIVNPESFTASPYMKIYAAGDVTLYINNRAYGFTGVEEYVEIDSEKMNAYKETVLQNNKMITAYFPKLVAGANNISWIGNVTKIEIIARWCSL